MTIADATRCEKLVRDGVPEAMRRAGLSPIIREAAPGELIGLLARKLFEEAGEFLENPSVEELGDVVEVLDWIHELSGFDRKAVQAAQALKRERLGGFATGTVLALQTDALGTGPEARAVIS